jgi:hypothetical protein
MSNRWELIERLALEMGVTKVALDKWRIRGVPYRFHLPLIRAAQKKTKAITD